MTIMIHIKVHVEPSLHKSKCFTKYKHNIKKKTAHSNLSFPFDSVHFVTTTITLVKIVWP